MTWIERLGRHSAALASLVACLSVLLGLLVPIYTDEIGWRFQARMAIDGGVDRFLAEHCGANTEAIVPVFIQPVRYFSAYVNLIFANPIFVRIAGVGCALIWLAMLWRLISQTARSPRERSALRTVAFSCVSLGVLPFLLVLSRPEQPLLLMLTLSLLVVTRSWEQLDAASASRPAWRAALVTLAGAIALSYYLKAIAYLPVFILCAVLSSRGRRGVLGRIDIHRSQIMAAARCTNPAKCIVRRS